MTNDSTGIARRARPEIRALRPYAAAEQVDDTVRLNANEVPFTTAPFDGARPLNRYPEIRPQRLRQLLAGRFGVEAERLLVCRGSSEAIDLLMRAFCHAGRDNVVTIAPTFSMYRHYAVVQGAEYRQVACTLAGDERFDVNAAELLSACDVNTRLLFLCSPNNPTGASMAQPTMRELLDALRDRTLVVVDEAYIEFSADASAAVLLDEYDNLAVLRTLSKAGAFAGARCGAVIARRPVIDLLDAIQAPYALATPVVAAVESAFDRGWLDAADREAARLIAERGRLETKLAALPGITNVWPSDANFLLVRFVDARAALARCAGRGILLRDYDRELPDCVRITVGSGAENDRLLAALASLSENCR